MKGSLAKARAVIEHIRPQIDGGEFPIKRIPGEVVVVKADVFGDGHDLLGALLLHRAAGEKKWNEVKMRLLENDQWTASFVTGKPGMYEYTVVAWVDHALSWHHGFCKKAEAGEHLDLELRIGAELLRRVAKNAQTADAAWLKNTAKLFEDEAHYKEALAIGCSERLEDLIESLPLRDNETTAPVYKLYVEREKAQYSTWYEFFPRSASPDRSRSGTFKDCEALLRVISELGFDTLYFPPIHPIGESHRKGKNNSTTALPGEPGSPWAIGSHLGGHKAINPELGTIEDFEHLVKSANNMGIEIALDMAYQCSPDHPYVTSHPQWFRWRPDGTVQYAENPPKKYQDVLPLNFETDDWQNLWNELKSVIEFWISKGIKIFRVDNPHTKPFIFWQWIMEEMRRDHPEVIFLSEAFTRPRITARLAKVGFQQSYSYFTWRQTKKELTEYLTELTQTELREYFRANFWPNTPDILPYFLQKTGHTHSAARFVLAATLSSNYGMYGPVYEMLENEPMPGKEEYFNSEKYEIRHWEWFSSTPFRELIRKINLIRKDNAAFHTTFNIEFCETDNEQLIAFFKSTRDARNQILTIINLDPTSKQTGWVKLPAALMPAHEGQVLEMNDLMDNSRYRWNRQWNYVELDPRLLPAHIFSITAHPH